MKAKVIEKDKFEYTHNGYDLAENYLRCIGEWNRISKNGTCESKRFIVSQANLIYSKLNRIK